MASFHTPSLGDEPSYQAVKAPANPLSAYALFFKETQASLKSQQPDATFDTVSKIVETMWQALDDNAKEKYKQENEREKARYLREKEAYERVTGHSLPVAKAAAVVPGPAGVEAGAARCIRAGCGRPSVRNTEWEDEYCSNQCVVLHCDTVFRDWVKDQTLQAQGQTV